MIRLMPFSGRPPPRIWSRPSSPLVLRSSTSRLSCPPCATSALDSEQVLDGRDELERVNRLLQKGVGARGQRLVSGLEDGDGEHGPGLVLLQAPAEVRALAARDHQLDDREPGPTARATAPRRRRRSTRRPPHSPRCAGRTASRSADTGSRSASSTSSRVSGTCAAVAQAITLAVLGEQSVRVGGRQALRDLRREKAQLLYLVA